MRQKKILIIDDDSIIRNALSEFFADKGFEVHVAKDGREGLEYFSGSVPDLTILDLIMPGVSGIECLEKIRAISERAKVVVLTAYGTDEQIAKLRQLGVTDVIRKGIGFEDFLAQIEGVLGRNHESLPSYPVDPTEIKVLVADDDTVIRTLLVEFLVGRGFQVINAKDGHEAYDLIIKYRPAIVFIDLVMPQKDGKTVLKEVPDALAKDIKWVLITGFRDKIKDVMSLGRTVKILYKPFSLENFESAVISLLKEFSIKI